MKTDHMQPIITNARQGLEVSTLNRRRANPGLAWLVVVVVALWIAAGFVFANL